MKQKLTTIGHCMDFNNEQSPYCIVSYKRLQNEKCQTIQSNYLIYVKEINENKYVTHQQTTTTELQASDFGQALHTECGRVKHV